MSKIGINKRRLEALINNLALGSKQELTERARSLIGIGGAIYTPNPIILNTACKDEDVFSAIMRGCNIPDGIGIKLACRIMGRKCDCLPGVELGEAIISCGVRFGIFGGAPGVAEDACDALCARYSKSRALFALDGYTNGKKEVREVLAFARPDVAIICLGSPKQELLIDELREDFPGVLFLALGGSADIYSGRKRRAPLFFRKLGLEWLWRMLAEPRRFRGIFSICSFLLYILPIAYTERRGRRLSKKLRKNTK